MHNQVYYNKFKRHAHGEGLKGDSTHYCPGCGHGLAHNYLADAIEELDIQDRTIAISPVGCAVFLYYYLDTGNSQAAHGRAPAVALGHKLANPNSIVISYQGDGDLASIGLAEIIQTAQMGLPISVIFVNNAIYGMTGGQLAPTSLMGMKTTTSPDGRNRMAGQPLKVAELIAQLDGPVYVERVALYDNKQRVRAKKAIKKAIRLQVENRGFSFVEILSECPVHLKMPPVEAQEWVKQEMAAVFPLGIKKDIKTTPWFNLKSPNFSPQFFVDHICDSTAEKIEKFTTKFPDHIDEEDIALKFAGAGGDGAQTAAMLVTRAAINEGFDSTHIPSYGPESRGGTSYADVHIAREEVLSPASPNPHILVAFNSPSLNKFSPHVHQGIILYDSSVILSSMEVGDNVVIYGVPFSQIAQEAGNVKIKNIVALGALQAATDLFPAKSLLIALEDALHKECSMLDLNKEAFGQGQQKFRELYP